MAKIQQLILAKWQNSSKWFFTTLQNCQLEFNFNGTVLPLLFLPPPIDIEVCLVRQRSAWHGHWRSAGACWKHLVWKQRALWRLKVLHCCCQGSVVWHSISFSNTVCIYTCEATSCMNKRTNERRNEGMKDGRKEGRKEGRREGRKEWTKAATPWFWILHILGVTCLESNRKLVTKHHQVPWSSFPFRSPSTKKACWS